ncbi:MAG: hypothetical protein ABRQ38_00475 [Candidatus Eremiobacterota bacterium]
MLGFRRSKKDISSNVETVSRSEKKYSTSTDYSRDRSKDLIVKSKEMLLDSPDFFCELRGEQPDEYEYKIFIIEHALKTIWKHAKEGMPQGVGGILLGGLYRDPEKNEEYVEIHNAFPSASSFNEEMSLRVVNRVIADMEQVSIKTYPNQIVIGWYHTHPDKGIFFSENDELIHETFYRESANVALILDPVMEIDPLRETYKNIAFFYWKDKSIEKSSGYYAYKPRQLAESISPTDKLREKYHRRLASIRSAREQLPPTEVNMEEEENQYGDFIPQTEEDDILFNAVRRYEKPEVPPSEAFYTKGTAGDVRNFSDDRNYGPSEEMFPPVSEERGSSSLLKGIRARPGNKMSNIQSVPKKRGLRVSPRSEIPPGGSEHVPSTVRDTISPPGIPYRAGSLPYDMRFNEAEPYSRSSLPENPRIEQGTSVSRNYGRGIVRKSPERRQDLSEAFRGSMRDFTSQTSDNSDDYSSGDYLSEDRRKKSSPDEAGDSLYIEFDSSEEDVMLDDEEHEDPSPYERAEPIREIPALLRKESPSFASSRREEEKRKRPPSFVKTPRSDGSRRVAPVPPRSDGSRRVAPVPPGPVVTKNDIEKEYIAKNYSKMSSETGNFISHTEGFSGREHDPEYDSFYNDTIQILGGRNWRMEQKQVIRDPDEASYPVRRTKSGLLKAHKYKYYGNEEMSEEERIEE